MKNNGPSCTFGQFIAHIEAETMCAYTINFIDKWKKGVLVDVLEKYNEMPVAPEFVASFAEDIVEFFRALISGTCSDELYFNRVAAMVDFTSLIRRQSRSLGISINAEDLSFSTLTKEPRIYPRIFTRGKIALLK